MSGLYKDGSRNFDTKLLMEQINKGEVPSLYATGGPETVTIRSGDFADETLIVASLTPLTSIQFNGIMSRVAFMSDAKAA